jgi:hypothetical protein
MTTGATGQLGLALPVQGELSGTWGDTVNNGITQYANIAIAATLTLTNDGAVTLANTTGDATASNITSSLTGAGTVTAQFAIVRVTGTLTTAKVVTAPSYSKTYTVVNAATGGIVTFKASGQTGVSIAVGESAFVYYNGTDYVKVSGTSAVSSFTAGTTGFTPSTATTGAVTLAGTLATTNGGTGLTSFTSGGVVYASSSSALATGSALSFSGANLGIGVTSPADILELYRASGNVITVYTSGSNISLVGTNSAGYMDIRMVQSQPMVFATANTERARISAAGDVGIGTSSPANKLDVRGSTNVNGSLTISPNTNLKNTFTFTTNASNDGRLFIKSDTTDTVDIQANGTSYFNGGNVGVGTSSPAYKLEVALGTTGQQSLAGFRTANATAANNAGVFIFATPSATAASRQAYVLWDADGADVTGSDYFYITKAGNSGNVDFIQQSSAAMTFQTSGTERARISSAGGFSVGTTADPGAGAIYATGNITAYYSDKRLKTVSGKIENALDKVAQLSGVYYTNNDTAKSFGYDSDEEQVGVIAQEVEAVLPQIVKAAPFDLDENNNSKSGENYKTVQYDKLVPLLIEAINELQAKVKALEAK